MDVQQVHSRRIIFNRDFLTSIDLVNESDRLYNIDESWFSGMNESKMTKVEPKGFKSSYVMIDVLAEHVTFTVCIGAAGEILPPLFTYSKSLPSDHDDFHQLGPHNAVYTVTESGHIDQAIYVHYLGQLEHSLSKHRPVVIFQDN